MLRLALMVKWKFIWALPRFRWNVNFKFYGIRLRIKNGSPWPRLFSTGACNLRKTCNSPFVDVQFTFFFPLKNSKSLNARFVMLIYGCTSIDLMLMHAIMCTTGTKWRYTFWFLLLNSTPAFLLADWKSGNPLWWIVGVNKSSISRLSSDSDKVGANR